MRLIRYKSEICLLAALSLLIFDGACGIVTRTRALVKGDIKVSVNIAKEANQDSPLAVDLVIVFDEDLLKQLANYSADNWFEKREQIQRDFPEGKRLRIWNWEWAPGQHVSVKNVPMKADAKGGLVFAQYLSEGDHRARFNPLEDFHIEFQKDTFKIIIND